MTEHKLNSRSSRHLLYCCLIVAGMLLVAWQFFTFMDVLQAHTAKAQHISRSASWSGHPVGTMPQAEDATAGLVKVQHENSFSAGMMRTDLP